MGSDIGPRISDAKASMDEAICGKLNVFKDDALSALYLSLRDSHAFRRLRDIRFLGAIDYAFIHRPNGRARFRRHSRFTHSLGVANLALRYAQLVGVSASDRRLLLVAAMLHDLGHAPLSHSLEPLFRARFGLNHHVATRLILEGRAPGGREISRILRDANVDVDRVIELLCGEGDDFFGFFSGPINFDTIDGIVRAYSYSGAPFSSDLTERVLDAALLREGEHHMRIVDRFWTVKDVVYLTMIGGRQGVLADSISQYCVNHLASLRPDDFYSTERDIFSRVPSMREALQSRSLEARMLSRWVDSINFNLRRFYVSSHADFYDRQDALRYNQTKLQKSIKLQPLREPTLFDAEGGEYWGNLLDGLSSD